MKIIQDKQVSKNFVAKPIKDEDYVMGASSLSTTVLMPYGHGWKAFRPADETQFKNGIDPQTCTMGGTLNAVEHLGKLINPIHFQSDLSERFGAIMQGQTGFGGWPMDAGMAVHRRGAIPEVYLPFNEKIDAIAKYFSPKPMSYALFKVGAHWASSYTFGVEWVVNPAMNLTGAQKKSRMKEALQYSILGVAGYAWALGADGKYYNAGPDIHFFTIDDYSEGDYWDAFDTYPPYGKKLDWNYDPNYVIRYSLTRKIGSEDVDLDNPPECRWEYFIYFISSFFKK